MSYRCLNALFLLGIFGSMLAGATNSTNTSKLVITFLVPFPSSATFRINSNNRACF